MDVQEGVATTVRTSIRVAPSFNLARATFLPHMTSLIFSVSPRKFQKKYMHYSVILSKRLHIIIHQYFYHWPYTDGENSIPGRNESLFSSQNRPDRLDHPPRLRASHGVLRLKHEVDHSVPSIVEFKNECNYISTLPYAFVAWKRTFYQSRHVRTRQKNKW